MDVSNLKCTSAVYSNFAFQIWMPDGADAGLKGPKLFDLTITAGSAIQINNPAGGFTDDNTSQQPLQGCFVERCGIYCSNFERTDTIGIQFSKISEGEIRSCDIHGFGTLIDLQGAENCRLKDNRLTIATSKCINAQSHGTFGNGLVIDSNFMVSMVTGANAFVVSSYKSIKVSNNWLEGNGNYTALFWLQAAVSAVASIVDNTINVPALSTSSTLKVDDTTDGTTSSTGYILIEYRNNLAVLLYGSPGAANFNGNTGLSYYTGTGALRRGIIHGGNMNIGQSGDVNFPFNNRASSIDSQYPVPNVVAYFSPADDGLAFVAHGTTVKCLNGAFAFGTTGSTNYLDFGQTNKVQPVGTLKLYILASSASGAIIHAAVTDNGSVVGSFAGQVLTSKPSWYVMNGGALVATAGGCRVYADASDVKLYAAVLSQ